MAILRQSEMSVLRWFSNKPVNEATRHSQKKDVTIAIEAAGHGGE